MFPRLLETVDERPHHKHFRSKTEESMFVSEPKIFGIVNVTEDSFSDGGRFLSPQKAIAHALELKAHGADFIDLGASASSPTAKPVSAQEEIKRLTPIIDELHKHQIAISVDTFYKETQRFCLKQNIAVINDIQGFPYPDFYAELAHSNCLLVLMHSIQQYGIANETYTKTDHLIERIDAFFTQRLTALLNAGIKRERIILDPGMGFFLGSNIEASTLVLKNISHIKTMFGLPILISVSRKSFLRNLTNRSVDEIQAATLAAEIYAAMQGVDYIRTHDVKALTDALKVLRALK